MTWQEVVELRVEPEADRRTTERRHRALLRPVPLQCFPHGWIAAGHLKQALAIAIADCGDIGAGRHETIDHRGIVGPCRSPVDGPEGRPTERRAAVRGIALGDAD